jgi:Mn2+/Fe2+ NRAMP family transporter
MNESICAPVGAIIIIIIIIIINLLARSVLKLEAFLGIMSKVFILLEQVTSLLQNPLSWRTRGFLQGFLSLDGLPTVAIESCLPAT